ncbi:fasciculation and elongation protein zeta-2-like [Uloborus diversus]|uniref:fasciculation and elongation protein zeta-2-like n=1 Tax=Uloborus diversus TaxID=327109 RepID=UPI0024099DDC|nr:fasciculation and elongation protein zeta-2-like [Uloborus diversus]
MAELKIQAPLAYIEDWPEFNDFQNSEDVENSNKDSFSSPETNENSFMDSSFSDAFSTSLEDLVNTFDEKITKCFYNYEENVEKLAPVQVRNQEEIMNECQIWWTLTGNFGTILPIDWTKSCAKGLQHNIINLNKNSDCDLRKDDSPKDNMDMRSLLIKNLHQEPLFTAEQVLEEIEEMIQQQRSPSSLNICETPDKSPDDLKGKVAMYIGMYKDEVKVLSLVQLHDLLNDLESLIQDHSETLIRELALRDELEYEKELKNTFISLILSIQNKRRQHNVDKKKFVRNGSINGLELKYLSTVIPYDPEQGSPDNPTLQILIKILQAINDDSPTVPTLLTDYILKEFLRL